MYKQILKKIKEYGTIIIHRHSRPDGDAMGSQIGLKEAIISTYPYKKVYCVGDVNEKFRFIGEMDEIDDTTYQNALVFALDSSDTSMLNDDRYKLGRYLIKIDHHISKEDYGDMNIVETGEVSCASLVSKIIFSNNMKLSDVGAKALFTGIVTDSGRFRYDNVSSDTFLIASKLLKYNFEMSDIYNRLYTEDLKIVKLRAMLTQKFSVTSKGVAYLKNTMQDIKDYDVDIFTISRGMVNVMSGIKGIDIWVNFTEDENNKVIVEIRSNKYNINPIATKYGGGGHKLASGATVDNFDVAMNLLEDLNNLVEE